MKRTNIIPPPDRETFEREIHDALENGDLSNIARILGKDQSLVSKQFNPYDTDRKNPVYEYLLYLWAADHTTNDLGSFIANLVERERGKWLPETSKAEPSPAALTGDIGSQFAEYVTAEISGMSIDRQIKELQDVEIAVRRKRDALVRERGEHIAGKLREVAKIGVINARQQRTK